MANNNYKITTKVFQDLVPTPAIVLPSYHGHLLYSPPDLTIEPPSCLVEELSSLKNEKTTCLIKPYQLVLLDIVDVIAKDFGKTALKELSSINPFLLPIMSYRGLSGPAVSADQKSISIQTKIGRKVVSLESYIERILIDKPIAAISLADEVNISSTGHNRLRKSVERTLTWFKTMAGHEDLRKLSPLFGTVVIDHNNKLQLQRMLDLFASSKVDGISIGGIHIGETASNRHNFIADVRRFTSEETFLMTHSADTLEEILVNIELGVDLVHSGYASKLTSSGSALSYTQNVSVEGDNKRECDNEAISTLKRRKIADEDCDKLSSALGTLAGNEEDGLQIAVDTNPYDSYSINLWNSAYRKDHTPLLQGCECIACLHHSRAYIHHLLKSKELLAEILLYHHNQFQLQELFCLARCRIRNGTFHEWKTKILSFSS